MLVRRDALDRLSDAVSRLADASRASVEAAWPRIVADATGDDGSIDVAALRAGAIAALDEAGGVCAPAAAMLSASFYDMLREAAVGEPLGEEIDEYRPPEATEGAVRGIVDPVAKALESGAPADAVADAVSAARSRVAARADYEVRRAANEAIVGSARRDPLGPRFARVPGGAKPCDFCIMLGSRGFVYHTAELASHAHANCRCRIVPGFPGMGVEGYDPDALYRQWRDGERAKARERAERNGPDVASGQDARNAVRTQGKILVSSARVASYSEHGHGTVSGVSNSSIEKWADQFNNEVLTISNGGTAIRIEGTPTHVDVPVDSMQLVRDSYLKHTHTTPIGGTFSKEDIALTTDGWAMRHEVEAELTGDAFALTRTIATKESAQKLKDDFAVAADYFFDEMLYNEWVENCKESEAPVGLQEVLNAHKKSASLRDEWLANNVEAYGYEYESSTR